MTLALARDLSLDSAFAQAAGQLAGRFGLRRALLTRMCSGETMTDSRKDKLHEFIDKTDPIIDQVDDYATTTFGWFKPVLYVAAAALVLKFILN